jgi:AraC-like DNA-binding protein
MKEPIHHIKSIREHHRILDVPLKHPLISIVAFKDFPKFSTENKVRFTLEFYTVSMKQNYSCKTHYGQTSYDFDEGLMGFTSPNQISGLDESFVSPDEGWLLMFHADFLLKHPLAQKIKEYGFFDYSTNEALILSEEEEKAIDDIFKNIHREYHLPIDKFSHDVLISQIDLLLTFCNRYYDRQFNTRKTPNHNLVNQVEELLKISFSKQNLDKQPISVASLAGKLNMSSQYLSDMLRHYTGLTAQQHIHNKLIEKAKILLSATDKSVSEIAFELGFGYSQSFSKLFKQKTNLSPKDYRQSFN